MSRVTGCLFSVLLLANVGTALAQSMPASQPNFLQILREEVKVGHGADHAKVEAGWPAAYEKAKSPYHYSAFVSMTGPSEVWFVSSYESQAAIGESMKLEAEPTLAAELDRLSKADGDQLNGMRSILARGRKDLSYGGFPSNATQRFYEVTIFRVRPGHEAGFAAAAKAYGAATGRAVPDASFRVYEVMAGMPGPTYLVFNSVTSYGAFDKALADDEATMKAATAAERETLEKFAKEDLGSSETIRFRLDPKMSYVPKDVREQDPAFWSPKAPAAAAKPAAKPEAKK